MSVGERNDLEIGHICNSKIVEWGEFLMDGQMEIDVCLTDTRSKPSELAAVTRDLTTSINRHEGMTARIPEGESGPEYRGDAQLLGNILLQLIASGGVVVTLINVLRTYVDRKPSLEFELTRKDGAAIKFKADNFGEPHISSFMKQLESFLHIEQ